MSLDYKFLYFVRSGYVNPYYGYLWFAGSESVYRAATTSSANRAHRLYFNPTGVDPIGSDTRLVGFSLRCLQE